MKTLLFNGAVITPWRILKDGYVLFDETGILEIGQGACGDLGGDAERIDVNGRYIAPGFIDIHVHGGGNSDFMDATKDDFLTAARTHLEHGTTSLFPTTVSSTNEALYAVLEAYKVAKISDHDGADLCGLHLEGPYFNLEMKGAMDPKYVRNPDMNEVADVLAHTNDIVRWSIAPELPGAVELGRFLVKNGILPSMGHSMAVYDEAMNAFESGFTLCTHLYSAMSGVRRIQAIRYAGIVETAMTVDDMDVEIIADGMHLPKTLLQLIYQTKGPGHIALITDAMRGAGQPAGPSMLGDKEKGMPCIIEDGVAKLLDRSALAGSVATTDRLVRVMHNLAGVPIEDAVRMATTTPARIMGMKNRGRLAPGYAADIVVFDGDVCMERVYRAGICRYVKQ